MANDLTKDPWIIDTASSTVLTTDRLRVKSMRWVGPTTADHEAIIQDKNAREVWKGEASGNADNDESLFEGDIEGLIVSKLESGKIYIYLR